MPAPTPPPADEPVDPADLDAASAAPPAPPSRAARTLAIGGLALAVFLGVTFGQVTGSLSDAATSPTGEGEADGARPGGAGGLQAGPPLAGLDEGAGGTGAAAAEGADPAAATSTTGPSPLGTLVARLREAESDPAPADPPEADADTDSDTDLLPAGGTLALGDRGPRVRALQGRLHGLGYWPGDRDGTFGEPTRQAVIAFQKAEELGAADGVADAAVVERLATASFGWGRSRSGEAIEIDRERQLLLVVRDGAVVWTLNTATDPGPSSGPRRGLSALPRGHHRVERQIDADYEAPGGTIHRPKYFDGTVAIQGTGARPDPPPQGCACLSDAAMDMLWSVGAATPGTPVLVY